MVSTQNEAPSSLPATEDDIEQLAKLGYKQELYRGLNGFMAFAFCFTSVSVIPSISMGFISTVGIGGPAEIVWAWVIGSLFCIISGAAMAEISSVYPSAGSVFHWAGQISPPEWSRVISYTCGWFNMLGNVAGDAAFASGFAAYVSYAYSIANPEAEDLSVETQVGISLAVIASWAALAAVRTDIQGFISSFAVFFQMFGSIIIVTSLMILAPSRPTAEFVFTKGIDRTNITLSSEVPYPGMPVSAYAVILGITSCLFAFTGYESGAHMAEEICDARRAAPRSVMGTVLCCAIFGLIYILGMIFATPDITALETPVQDIYEGAAGQKGGFCLMLMLVVCMFFAGQSTMTVSARIIYALARDDALPFSSSIKYVDPNLHTPIPAVATALIVDSLLLLLPLINTSALAAITGTCTVGLQISYAIPIILRCTVGSASWKPGAWNLGRLSYPVAVVAAVWQVGSSALFFLPYVYPVTMENMNWTVVVVASTLSLAYLNWLLYARKVFRGRCLAAHTPEDLEATLHSEKCKEMEAGKDGLKFATPELVLADHTWLSPAGSVPQLAIGVC